MTPAVLANASGLCLGSRHGVCSSSEHHAASKRGRSKEEAIPCCRGRIEETQSNRKRRRSRQAVRRIEAFVNGISGGGPWIRLFGTVEATDPRALTHNPSDRQPDLSVNVSGHRLTSFACCRIVHVYQFDTLLMNGRAKHPAKIVCPAEKFFANFGAAAWRRRYRDRAYKVSKSRGSSGII